MTDKDRDRSKSVFIVTAGNQLGLEFQRTRAKLLSLAL